MSVNQLDCAICGSLSARPMSEKRQVIIGRRRTTTQDEYIRCDACGAEYATPEQVERTQQRAVAQIRTEEGLLTPQDIRRIREKYCLSQARLELLLRTGPKTVVRWERGTVFQSAAADTLLRLLDDDPAIPEALARIAELAPTKLQS
jgi:HTH-type transcriptional regulator/antitoxin MqsA